MLSFLQVHFLAKDKCGGDRPSGAPPQPPSISGTAGKRHQPGEAHGKQATVSPVVSVLEVPGQLALGQDVMERGLRPIICCKDCNTEDSTQSLHSEELAQARRRA